MGSTGRFGRAARSALRTISWSCTGLRERRVMPGLARRPVRRVGAAAGSGAGTPPRRRPGGARRRVGGAQPRTRRASGNRGNERGARADPGKYCAARPAPQNERSPGPGPPEGATERPRWPKRNPAFPTGTIGWDGELGPRRHRKVTVLIRARKNSPASCRSVPRHQPARTTAGRVTPASVRSPSTVTPNGYLPERTAVRVAPALHQHAPELTGRSQVQLDAFLLLTGAPGGHRRVRAVAAGPRRAAERGRDQGDLRGEPPGGAAGHVRAVGGHDGHQVEQAPAHLPGSAAEPVVADDRDAEQARVRGPDVADRPGATTWVAVKGRHAPILMWPAIESSTDCHSGVPGAMACVR